MVGSMTTVFVFYHRSKRSQCFFNGNSNFNVSLVSGPINGYRVAGNVIILVSIRMVSVVARYFSRAVAVVWRKNCSIGTRTIRVVFFRPRFAIERRRIGGFILTMVGTG